MAPDRHNGAQSIETFNFMFVQSSAGGLDEVNKTGPPSKLVKVSMFHTRQGDNETLPGPIYGLRPRLEPMSLI